MTVNTTQKQEDRYPSNTAFQSRWGMNDKKGTRNYKLDGDRGKKLMV
jgi:hypothetical protein